MKRIAYRQMNYSKCPNYPNGIANPLRLAPSGAVGNPAIVFGNRHLDAVPHSCAFSAKGKGGKTPASRKNMVDLGHSSGNGMGSPQNKKKEEWPLYAPHNVCLLIDDLIYKAVEAGYNWANKIAQKLGKKNPISKKMAAVGASALGGIPCGVTHQNADGQWAWGTSLESVATMLAAPLILAGAIKLWEITGKYETGGEEQAVSEISFGFMITRFPTMLVSAACAVAAFFSENALVDVRSACGMAGLATAAYILSGENGTWKKVKKALGKVWDKCRAGFAQKSPVPVKGPGWN